MNINQTVHHNLKIESNITIIAESCSIHEEYIEETVGNQSTNNRNTGFDANHMDHTKLHKKNLRETSFCIRL